MEPGLYTGTIRHRRFTPREHSFTYSLFMALIDIDRIGPQMSVSRLTAMNGFSLAAFHDSDHIGDPSRPLRERVQASAEQAGHTCPEGPIYLLTHLRYAGYVFNPISLYYCCDADGHVKRVLADVRNTYGGRRSYWLTPFDDSHKRFRAFTDKTLYVSPFMTLDAKYEFILTPPAQSLVAHMNVDSLQTGDRIFDATLTLERRAWTAANVRRTLLAYPLMTAKVIGGIHLEALRLRLKGLSEVPAVNGRH
ncbi:MAG TPA: DUF1365 domain-containing protein [Vicinamibacterales bacterium]|nr:DUF1365 domain-containing protein [Vicinamibacterales bacterium]